MSLNQLKDLPTVSTTDTPTNGVKIPSAPLQTLPSVNFSDPSKFSIMRTTITRTELSRNKSAKKDVWSSALLSDPFTSGIVSITITILSFPRSFHFGLMDSTSPIPKIGEILGYNVKNSVALNTDGTLWVNTPSSDSYHDCHPDLEEGDCVRMEVDLDSTPRTVQFFVNGEAVKYYVSGIPSSVQIGFSIYSQRTAFRIDNISRLPQPTPISEEMEELKW
ncbi:hypothetical protein BLNAU_15092 [Blattamonas nauphoetae]|uniref:B30.2/SPRY domain-containing protein n=1 Tax=Blattamonas nauphoetae TaxID=2049346 RepID=A0ABQ9XFE6_9EUKA|nr:hypothetical protein BLNAU_15092 [Blattamonas nauphoetae]